MPLLEELAQPTRVKTDAKRHAFALLILSMGFDALFETGTTLPDQ
tara:strand:+ start:875 stop:1009 length:135 start_codon:yes stop_codon:yes gene_type:complete